MPPLETKDLLQYAVLWGFIGYDDYNKPIHDLPIQLSPPLGVRWTWKRTMLQDPQGNNISIDAQAIVPFKIAPDSLMWLGTLSDWYGTGSAVDPLTLGNQLCIVKDYREAVDIKNRPQNTRRRVSLMKYQGHPNVAVGDAFIGSDLDYIGDNTQYIGAT